VAGALERRTVRQATRLNVVSGGFMDYFRRRYPALPLSCIANGIDDEFLAAGPAVKRASPHSEAGATLSVVYAGNIGEGQGLHRIVPPLARALGARIRFRIIGDGGRRQALLDAIAAAGVANVDLIAPVGRAALIEEYRKADILFLHLNDYPAFEKVLPSKLFEYAAMGKPVWAGVAGFSAQFVEREIPNAAVFLPCDVAAAIAALGRLTLADIPRTEFIARFGRRAVSRALAADVLSLLPAGR
jgi:glycosyltransferase involved in cell wall biosynthesis